MTESDWPTLLTWNQDPRVLVTWNSGNTKPWSLSQLQTVYRNISRRAFMFILEWNGQPIGEAWLQEMNLPEISNRFRGENLRRIDLSIGRTELWGQGLGSEAVLALVRFGFEEERADMLFACDVSDSNPASRRVFEKVGFAELRPERQRNERHGTKSARHLVLTRARWLKAGMRGGRR